MQRIEPEPERDEREAILAALAPEVAEPPPHGGQRGGGWAETALREAVSGEAASPLTEHDVYSLW